MINTKGLFNIRGALLISLLMFSSFCSLLSASNLKTDTLDFSSGKALQAYYRYVLKVTDDNTWMLYEKDLDYLRELPVDSSKIKRFHLNYDTLFVHDDASSLHVVSLKDSVEPLLLSLEAVTHFDMNASMLYVASKQSAIKSIDYHTKHVYWEQPISSSDLALVPGADFIVSVHKNQLQLLSIESGELLHTQSLSKGHWSIEQQWSRAVVLSNQTGDLVLYDFASQQLRSLEIKKESILAWVRQKEAILINEESQLLSCYDVEQSHTRWMHYFDQGIMHALVSDEGLLVITDENDLLIWNHFTAQELLKVALKEAEKPALFYRLQRGWYVAFSEFMLYIKEDDDKDAIN